LKIAVTRLDRELPLPTYARAGDAGLDLLSAEDVTLQPGERATVPTGLAVAIPEGHAGFVHPRSGKALKEGLGVANAPGLIDSGYRGEIKVIVVNLDPRESVRFERFDRIAQLVVQQVERVRFRQVAELPDSVRAGGGFGSTGGHAETDRTSGTSGQVAEGGPTGGNRYASVVSDREGQ